MHFAARCTAEPHGLAGHCSRDEEQTSLQFVSWSVHMLECVDMTHMTVQRDDKHRG